MIYTFLPIEIINRVLCGNHIVIRSSSKGLNRTGNPSLSVIPFSLTIKVSVFGKNIPIVQCVHDIVFGNVFIFFFKTINAVLQSLKVGDVHLAQWSS